MTGEWFDDYDAINLIRRVRSISETAATQVLVQACAEGVTVRQRACYDDFWLTIPAAVWCGAHYELATGELFPAGTDLFNPLTTEGEYGHGGNGIIQFNEADLRAWLQKPVPGKRGRPPKVDWNGDVRQRVFTWLDYHGTPDTLDPEWGTQAAVEKAVMESGVSAAPSTVRRYVSRFMKEWIAQIALNARN
jgi:hypothetical protein